MKASLLTLFLLCPALVHADCTGVRFSGAWLREPPPGASGTAGYLQVHNAGKAPATLRDWQSKRFAMTMLHETIQTADQSSMRHRETLDVPAGVTVTLAPGGLHLMLMGPEAPLQAGETVEFVVTCGDSTLTFPATVKAE